jgi:hypothetical protein
MKAFYLTLFITIISFPILGQSLKKNVKSDSKSEKLLLVGTWFIPKEEREFDCFGCSERYNRKEIIVFVKDSTHEYSGTLVINADETYIITGLVQPFFGTWKISNKKQTIALKNKTSRNISTFRIVVLNEERLLLEQIP